MCFVKTDFSKIEYPDILYKYRKFNDPYQDRFITNREVYLASPSDFEDNLDCANLPRHDLLTKSQEFEYHYHLSKRSYPYLRDSDHKASALIWCWKNLFKDPEKIKNFQTRWKEEYFKRRGVLSLTANSRNPEMWEKYGDENKGYCIGYDSSILFKYMGGGGEVGYYDTLPIIYPVPLMERSRQLYLNDYAKEIKWKFEEEYRCVRFFNKVANTIDRQIQLPREAFKTISIGVEMSEENRFK
ncbi:MAG: DUF2971 domain-containing protein, partial [Flavobacteriaceae bacterium]